MDENLHLTINQRLIETGATEQDWGVLVIAACESAASLEKVLGGRPAPATSAEIPTAKEPKGAYLGPLTVQGFRGIGPEVTLNLAPGTGLTLVVGRNGTGKSSFAEALEVLLISRNLEFLYSHNRLNVAVSRARAVSVVVGSPLLLAPRCRTLEHMRLANALCLFNELAGGPAV